MRRASLDHLLVLGEPPLRRTLIEYVAYFNRDRPHQGLQQRIPDPFEDDVRRTSLIRVTPVLGGLHHPYRRAA